MVFDRLALEFKHHVEVERYVVTEHQLQFGLHSRSYLRGRNVNILRGGKGSVCGRVCGAVWGCAGLCAAGHTRAYTHTRSTFKKWWFLSHKIRLFVNHSRGAALNAA